MNVQDGRLTARQERVLRVYREFAAKHGCSPSFQEIGAGAGLSSLSSVSYQVNQLERKGFLVRQIGVESRMYVLAEQVPTEHPVGLWVIRFFSRFGRPPTVTEVADALGLSKEQVAAELCDLVASGVFRRVPGRSAVTVRAEGSTAA